jgi:hypothetical protein
MLAETDRRTRRSSFRFPATALYLDALVRREGLSAAVLADEDGPMAGRSAVGGDLDDLASLGALGLRGSLVRDVGHEVWAQTLRVGDRNLVLTTLGGRVRAADVERDLGRIFAGR